MRATTLAFPLALLAASASSEPQLPIAKNEAQEIEMSLASDCVAHATISRFEPLDDRQIVLSDKDERKAYLAEMAAGCFNIEMQTMFITVDGDGDGQICGDGRDSLRYRRLSMVDSCRIIGLEELSDDRRLELGVGSPHSKSKKEGEEDAAKDDAQ